MELIRYHGRLGSSGLGPQHLGDPGVCVCVGGLAEPGSQEGAGCFSRCVGASDLEGGMLLWGAQGLGGQGGALGGGGQLSRVGPVLGRAGRRCKGPRLWGRPAAPSPTWVPWL